MRKGLITLMTVATVVISLQAQAMAPVISDIPSPIVGNKGGTVSQPTAYTYPDALDLNTLASDDNIASDQLLWSYEIVGTQKFAINGDAPINSVSENVVSPPTAKQIRTQWNGLANADAGDDPNLDSKVNTITIRNIQLFPFGGTASSDNSAAAQNWANNMQAVTFWCSDGNLATSKTVMFYTDNTYNGTAASGYSRLSGSSVWTKIKEWTGTQSWSLYDTFFDKCTSGTLNGKGVCFNVATTGQNWGSVASGAAYVTLTDNMVYRIRANMNCDQLSPGKTPFWDFILENWDNFQPAKGMNLYGFDSFYLDNEGGANTVISRGAGSDMTMYWAPLAFQTAQWRNTTSGIFAANTGVGQKDYRLLKDAQLRFRVLDVDSNATLGNNNKSGKICMMNVIVETCPVSRKVYTSGSSANPVTADKYAVTSGLKAAHANPNDTVPGNMITSSLTGATISYASGVLTITPTGTSRQNDMVTITPATDLKTPENSYGSWADLDDDYPIAWEANKVYELEVKLSAPTAADAASPWDVVWFNLEPFSNEMIAESFVTANNNIAMPKNGTAQSYYLYYWSGLETVSGTPAMHFLRWRIRFANSTNLNWPSASDAMNTGAVRVHSVKVNTVDFR